MLTSWTEANAPALTVTASCAASCTSRGALFTLPERNEAPAGVRIGRRHQVWCDAVTTWLRSRGAV